MGAGRDDGDETKRSYLYISIPPNAGVCEIRENQMHTGVRCVTFWCASKIGPYPWNKWVLNTLFLH